MKPVIFAAVLFFAVPAHAQYKCTVNGKTSYSDVPCAANARYVGAMQDNVSDRSRAEAELLRRKQAMQRNSIERQQNNDFQQSQRALAQQAAADDVQNRARASRCAEQRRDLAENRRAQERYQEWGWQKSLNGRQQEAKAINDNIFRECP